MMERERRGMQSRESGVGSGEWGCLKAAPQRIPLLEYRTCRRANQ